MGDQGHISHLLGSVPGLLMPFDDPEHIHLSLPCPQRQFSSLGDPQGLSMRFISSCSTTDPEQHDPRIPVSPAIVHSIRYPESSQRTTSAFPSFAQYDNRNFTYVTSSTALSAPVPLIAPLACSVSSEGNGWVSGQDVEEDTLTHLGIQSLNYPDIQCPSRRAQVSPDSASTEYTSTDDSDVETGTIMSKMMVRFQVHTPSLNADMSMRIPEQGLPTPSLMTFRLGRRSLRLVADPDSAKILENFNDLDEDTSEDSCESLSLSSSPLYSPTSCYDGRGFGSCGDDIERTINGVTSPTKRRLSHTPDGIPSFCESDRRMRSRRAPHSARSRTNSGSSRKSKMHECKTCHKIFPRPSGLKTHMNSHSGAKRTFYSII